MSVVIPSHNRKDVIGWTLDSALAQTYDSYEILVVDDASTDGLAVFLAERYPTVRVLRLDTNQGVAAARNRGVAAAQGELIAFLDNDDLWSPDKLLLQVRDLDAYPKAVLSFTDITFGRRGTDLVYSRTQPFEPHRVFEQLTEGGPILPSAVLLRKRDFEAADGFDPLLPPAEDRDLWLRLAARGPFRFLPLPLARRVVYADSFSHRSELWEASFNRVLTNFLERPEGAPYRSREHVLRAFQLWKIGARHALKGAWRPFLRYAGRSVRLDPLVALRRPGRRILRDVARRGEADLFSWIDARVGRVVGPGRLDRLLALTQRLSDVLLGYRLADPPAPLPGVVFRPPPDAPGPRTVMVPEDRRT